MKHKRAISIARMVRSLLLLLFAGAALHIMAPSDAEARAGGRRSVGRNTGRPAPAQDYRSQPNASPNSQPMGQAQRGGFMRGLAGGLAGGFLGSMLFSSLGHAAGGAGGAGGGGMGFIEIILIAGIAFLAFRWWKNRQQATLQAGGVSGPANNGLLSKFMRNDSHHSGAQAPRNDQSFYATGSGSSIEAEEASDIFFKVQAAWTRRDLSSITALLGPEVYQALMFDLGDLKARKQINRLENISVRKVDILDRWNDQGVESARVRFTANLLDYTVDEQNGALIEGSNTEPVKFEEDWIFSRTSAYSPWQLVGISQV